MRCLICLKQLPHSLHSIVLHLHQQIHPSKEQDISNTQKEVIKAWHLENSDAVDHQAKDRECPLSHSSQSSHRQSCPSDYHWQFRHKITGGWVTKGRLNERVGAYPLAPLSAGKNRGAVPWHLPKTASPCTLLLAPLLAALNTTARNHGMHFRGPYSESTMNDYNGWSPASLLFPVY